MKSLKKLGLIFGVIAFCLSLSVFAAYAQPGKAKWEGNKGKHKGWTKGKHKGWYKNDARRDERWERRDDRWERRTNRGYARGRINSDEYTRLQRQRARLEALRDRYYSDNRYTRREERKYNRKSARYNRRITRANRTP